MFFVAGRSKRGMARPRQTGTSLFVWLSCSLLHRNLREYFKIVIAALPYLFANRSRQNDASVRSGSGPGFGISVHEETAATASVGFGSGLQSQHTGAVVASIHRRPGDGPVSARDWANVGHVLHSGIVLPCTSYRNSQLRRARRLAAARRSFESRSRKMPRGRLEGALDQTCLALLHASW